MDRVVKKTTTGGKWKGKRRFNDKSDDEPAEKKSRKDWKRKGKGKGKKPKFNRSKTSSTKARPESKKGGGDSSKGSSSKTGQSLTLPLLSPSDSERTFLSLATGGYFVPEALAIVRSVGLDIESAKRIALLPIGGRISKCPETWHNITRDNWVLEIISQGYKVQFLSIPYTPMRAPNPPTDADGKAVLDAEVEAMLAKGAIREVTPSKDEVVSPFFARPKSTPGKWRPIVSLKKVNKHIRYVKFKMVTVRDLRLWIRRDHFFTSIDLQDAYFSIPLHETVWRFIRFVWNDLTYEFMVNMFGLGPSARLFTKVLAAVIRFLRERINMLIQGYIDDLLIQAITKTLCYLHTQVAIIILQCLGFEVNFCKSVLDPSQFIAHIGFDWDSRRMTISLPQKKIAALTNQATSILERGGCSADELRSFIGKIEGTRPAVELAALHYRHLQVLLPPASRWRGHKHLHLTKQARMDLRWWRDSLSNNATAPLRRGSFDLDLVTDASGRWGWGGHSHRGFAQGPWEGKETSWHINMKELIAGRKCLGKMMKQGDYVQLSMDSKPAVAFVNRQGGTRSRILCAAALELWNFVISKGGWLPRDENQISDMLSKGSLDTWEFGLTTQVTNCLWNRWFVPSVDCFASKLFHVVDTYYSFHPDTGAARRDAFSVLRWPNKIYAFPPIPLITMTITKIKLDSVTAIMVVPEWRSAKWWDMLKDLLVEPPLHLGDHRDILVPHPDHRLPHLGHLVACLLDGSNSRS